MIRAAYRALMRHYHPDTNPDPVAQERARAITAAFAVLGDPAKRAEYDAQRPGHDLAFAEELPDQRPPPAMRGLGIASAALALTLVGVVWAWPSPDPPRGDEIAAPAPRTEEPAVRPPEELEPQSVRLARLRGESAAASPPVELVPPVAEPEPIDPPLLVPEPPPAVRGRPVRVAIASPRRPIRGERPAAPPPAAAARANADAAASEPAAKDDRLATLDRMAAGFFSQSMAHADAAKKQLLLSAHTRSATTRKACRSDTCVTKAYLRQMREITAIMEGRELPQQ